MKHNSSKTRKTWTRILLVAAFAVTLTVTVGRQPFSPAKQAEAKTVSAKKYNQYEHIKKIGNTRRTYFLGYDVKKVKSSDTSILTAKVTKKRQSELNVYGVVATAKKKGIAKVTVTLSDGSKAVLKYDVGGALTKEKKSKKSKEEVEPKFSKKKAQKAFDIQNSYRADEGVDALEWSDELYEFCKYRLETSGYDSHENLNRDIKGYFGTFVGSSDSISGEIGFGENMYSGPQTAKKACEGWKNSSGHYHNMISSSYQCGAIAYDEANHYWVAVFSRAPASTFADWQGQMENYATVTFRCLDSASGEYLNLAYFNYYDKDDKSGTLKRTHTNSSGEKTLTLEIGKTYVFYSTGFSRVTLTVTGDCEVILATE